MVQKNITCFFGNAKRKSDSEENAPPSKKHPPTDTPDVPCTNSCEMEIPPGNPEILPSRSSSSVDPSTSPTADEVLVTSSRTFSDDSSVPSHGLNDASPTQVLLKKFPARKFGAKSRSFSSAWYKGKPWLEYSVATDSAYCFPCRVFGVNAITPKFCVEGYDDWKHALDGWNELENVEKDPSKKKLLKGFAKHVSSGQHKKNMEAWRSKEQREKSGKTIEATVQKINSDHKIWLEVIFTVIRSLAADGLPLRGKISYTLFYIRNFFIRNLCPSLKNFLINKKHSRPHSNYFENFCENFMLF